jgi:plastocyanin
MARSARAAIALVGIAALVGSCRGRRRTASPTPSRAGPATKDAQFDGQVAAGSTFSVTFTDAGTFKYFCAIHNSMTGTITVN